MLAGELDQPTLAYQHLVAALRSAPSQEQVAEAQRLHDKLRSQVRTMPLRFA